MLHITTTYATLTVSPARAQICTRSRSPGIDSTGGGIDTELLKRLKIRAQGRVTILLPVQGQMCLVLFLRASIEGKNNSGAKPRS